MKKLSIVALVVAILSAGVSGVALYRTRDLPSSTSSAPGGTTSTTTQLVDVPFEGGQDVFKAAGDLQAVGLGFTVVMAPSVTVPKGRVLSQSPLEGTSVPRGTVIQLTVSSGPTT
jgi:beta-lactam-binding protein with PASTA domain